MIKDLFRNTCTYEVCLGKVVLPLRKNCVKLKVADQSVEEILLGQDIMVYIYSLYFTMLCLNGHFLSLKVNNFIYLCRKVFTFAEIQINVFAYLLSALLCVLE